MEANAFIAKLKADGSKKDICDLDRVFQEYKAILANLSAKDKGPFSLNVLCIFGRNLGKVPSWGTAVDSRALLAISIECVRETRVLQPADRVKALACIYHLHKHVVKQNTQIPPELVLKISYMPFELDAENLFKEHCKIYWNILIDRMIYIEKLKSRKMTIIKLLTKLTEDVKQLIHIYDSVEFCNSILVYLVKRLHSLYNDTSPVDLDKAFEKIFDSLSKKHDLRTFKKLPESELLDLYIKFNECLYVIAENSSKTNFKAGILNSVVRICIALLGHSPALLHCFQTFYSNSFCSLLNENSDILITENILNSLPLSCEAAEKLDYKKVMLATYPFLNQFLRLYIESTVANCDKNKWSNVFTETVQESCLNLMLFLMDRLKFSKQLLKCENCKVQSGLHDSLRLSFLVKHFVSTSLAQGIDITKILPVYCRVVLNQYKVLMELCSLGCTNYEKCYKKLQGDIHNTAILLNKSINHEYPIQLFDIYLKNEIKHFRSDTELKNISRALYNKSICELDFKFYDKALRDAYLSLVFAYPEALNTEKHMNLVMDIKAKALKVKNDENSSEIEVDEENRDDFQLTTVFDVIMKAVDDNYYGNLKPFLCNLKFSVLLKHEFSMYVKLWPSVIPIAGVWRSLYDISKMRNIKWLSAKDDKIVQTLYEVILETPTAVRSIHSEYYKKIVTELLENFDNDPPTSAQLVVVHGTLLFLRAEYDLAEASLKYEWKVTEPNLDPDAAPAPRTVRHESAALAGAARAVRRWADLGSQLETVPVNASLRHSLQTAQVFVQHFLHAARLALGLQLAHVCCLLARHVGDKQAYIRNAGTILYYADRPSEALTDIIMLAGQWWSELLGQRDSMETALVFLCDSAIYYNRCGSVVAAATLVRLAQARILQACDKQADVNLDLAVGRLMEAQTQVCRGSARGPGALSAANGTQRHYLTVANAATKWSSRRLRSLTIKHHSCRAGVAAARLCRALVAWRRARAAAGAALPLAAALPQAVLHAAITNTHALDDAQVKIENRLKHILGLLTNETKPSRATKTRNEPGTPEEEIETMLENLTFKQTQVSPSVPCIAVPGFQIPQFFKHDSSCQCYSCQIPECVIMACQIRGLEASTYFRAKEFEIAKNYFEGTLRCFYLVERKLKCILKGFRAKFEGYIVDILERRYDAEFKRVKLEILIEAAFFELSQGKIKMADEMVVQIHEIIQETDDVDPYLRNEVFNLMTTSALVRKGHKIPEYTGLESDMESLNLSPAIEPPKTPEIKPKKPPIITRLIVNDEEVPNTKRRVIKLNLDDGNSEEQPAPRRTKRALKIPPPITTKPVLESLTPCKPRIIITQPSLDSFDVPTPKSKPLTRPTEDLNFDFATPRPSEESIFEFATPRPKESKKCTLVKSQASDDLNFDFATPRPKTAKPAKAVQSSEDSVFDFATPKPKINLNAPKPSHPIEDTSFDFATPKVETKTEFFTPLETPSEQFFTPITSVKTYSKRNLRKDIVKNLESEFSTPKIDKNKENTMAFDNSNLDIASKAKNESTSNAENETACLGEVSNLDVPKPKTRSRKVETGSLKTLRDKRNLRRATSPGKLVGDEKTLPTRSSRLRQPVRFSVCDNKGEKK